MIILSFYLGLSRSIFGRTRFSSGFELVSDEFLGPDWLSCISGFIKGMLGSELCFFDMPNMGDICWSPSGSLSYSRMPLKVVGPFLFVSTGLFVRWPSLSVAWGFTPLFDF